MTLKQTVLMAICLSATASSFAAINNNAATHGQWRNSDGNTISVGADGVKQYADNADECRSMGYKMTGARFKGSEIKASMQSTLAYDRENLPDLKADSRYAEGADSLAVNIQTIQRLLPMGGGIVVDGGERGCRGRQTDCHQYGLFQSHVIFLLIAHVAVL